CCEGFEIDCRKKLKSLNKMSDKQNAQKSAKIAAGAVVCVESEIRGEVTIGARTVVHPKARIIAEAGPIVIGEGNLIEEQALIINSYPENIAPDSEGVEPKTMTIGINNVFEVGCMSQAMKIGDNNVIESKADLGRNMILTSGCIIGACCQVNTCEVIPENTITVQTERPQILPNYHHMKKTVKTTSAVTPSQKLNPTSSQPRAQKMYISGRQRTKGMVIQADTAEQRNILPLERTLPKCTATTLTRI
uniref:Dynactin subunit 6 n=1 Tax=Oncorhynchus tshawytscha TaxID=74940 RepID=A0AAZ3SPI7_ONCTS